MTGGKRLRIMRNFAISTRNNFIRKFLTAICALTGSPCLISEREQGFFPEICTGTGRSGRRRIFRRTRINPDWSGAGETVHPIGIPDCYREKFELIYHEEFPLEVPFTRESWNGRMKACRGIGASLSEKEIAMWEEEHRKLLTQIAPDEFFVLHYGAIAELRKK